MVRLMEKSTLMRDLMLLKWKVLVGSPDSWYVLVVFWVTDSGCCTSTTWPL